MVYEAARALAWLKDYPEDQVGSRLREALDEGATIPAERYIADRAEINRLRHEFFRAFDLWTVLGGPVLTLTTDGRSNGLPLGCILCGYPGTDLRTGAVARMLCRND